MTPSPQDTTRHWLRRLPASRRPLRLCAEFPHVAQRLAWCWPDLDLSQQALDDLLTDRRGGRRGFPPRVVRELQRLRDFNGPDGPLTGVACRPRAAAGVGDQAG
ncbi:MAG: hypothetical protein H7Z19_05820 [Chitinophagaceae bacterium]|nr:hypothetical protein [Rubrivivax sp.]